MIDKNDAQKQGFNTLNRSEARLRQRDELFQKLKAILPELIDSDNILNIRALEDAVDLSDTTSNNQGYELTFAGKGLAKAKAEVPTDKELKVEQGQSKNFDSAGNVVIRGDNLDVLKILKQNYTGKVKCIYIDPPYNTESDGFIYSDDFRQSEEQLIADFGLQEETVNFLHDLYKTKTHSGWLAFMYPRLKLARQLLTEDGVIFISIDDKEQANLKILCDELFGEDNFVANFIWNHRKSMQNDIVVSLSHNSTLCYSKNGEGLNRLSINEEKFSNPDNDPRGLWVADPFDAPNIRPNLTYPIVNPNTSEQHLPPSGRCWRFSQTQFSSALKDNRIIFNKNGLGRPQYKRFLSEAKNKGKSIGTIWNDIETSERGSDRLAELFQEKNVFSFPKPVELIYRIITISTNPNDIVLDFFAGSGTTGEAVMRLNAEDGGSRKFILVQWDEKIPEDKAAYEFCKKHTLEPVISSITLERLRRAGAKIEEER